MKGDVRAVMRQGAGAVREAVLRREYSVREIAEVACDLVAAHNPVINAFVEHGRERTLDIADQVDWAVGRGRMGDLTGVPYGIKDTVDVAGLPTTWGSRSRRDWVAKEDSAVARSMREAGGVFLGKTNTPELGGRCTTAFGLFGPTRNPWSLSLSAGGSSGGAAAAVASGMVPIAHGTDGGGSVRIPASCCGVVGFKPSRGRVSNLPHISPAAGLVVQGVLARRTGDAEMVLRAIMGYRPGDPYWLEESGAQDMWGRHGAEARVRIGLVRRASAEPVDTVGKAFAEALELMSSLGWYVERSDVDLSGMVRQFRIVLESLFGSEERPAEGFTDEYMEWCWERGQRIGSTDYVKALDALQCWGSAIAQGTQEFDALVTPTLTDLPGDVDKFQADVGTAAAVDLKFIAFTYPFNVSGQPAISLPLCWSASGVPIGIQLVGRPGGDFALLRLAQALEVASEWPKRWPPLVGGDGAWEGTAHRSVGSGSAAVSS